VNPAGAEAERQVRRHYRLRGYRLLGANVWAGGAELDLVLRRGRRILFCEVKMRRGRGFGAPVEAVGDAKMRQLRRAAEGFLACHPELRDLEVAFEVAAVEGRRIQRVPIV
jgi:putative endonuclease